MRFLEAVKVGESLRIQPRLFPSSSFWITVTRRKTSSSSSSLAHDSGSLIMSMSMKKNLDSKEEEETEGKEEKHYNHTDPFNRFRWTARESFEYMYNGGRSWDTVANFYSVLVSNDNASVDTKSDSGNNFIPFLSTFFPHAQSQKQHKHIDMTKIGDINKKTTQHQEHQVGDAHQSTETKSRSSCCISSTPTLNPRRGGRWERLNFKIVISYHGPSFDGWQKQPALNTVQGLVEKALGRFVDDKKAQQLRDNSLPLEGCSSVAGRTDKGVSALRQVCSFYTWRKDVKCEDIKDAINDAAPGILRAISVSEVSRAFHPNFAAKWRRYFYIFPFDDGDQDSSEGGCLTRADEHVHQMKRRTDYDGDGKCFGNKDINVEMKPRSFTISKVNELIRQLEGKTLSYRMFARDTKASRSIGPPTECHMFHARAAEAFLPLDNQVHKRLRVMCVELVANRFLRKMVRVLVATAIREAAAGVNNDALLKLMDASCRRATAPPAPPDGLCLVDVGYEDFQRENCFIQD